MERSESSCRAGSEASSSSSVSGFGRFFEAAGLVFSVTCFFEPGFDAAGFFAIDLAGLGAVLGAAFALVLAYSRTSRAIETTM